MSTPVLEFQDRLTREGVWVTWGFMGFVVVAIIIILIVLTVTGTWESQGKRLPGAEVQFDESEKVKKVKKVVLEPFYNIYQRLF